MQKSSKPEVSSNEKVTKKKVSKKTTKDLFDINITAQALSKKETKKPIIASIIAVNELILFPSLQLSFSTLGIMVRNKPNIIEKLAV